MKTSLPAVPEPDDESEVPVTLPSGGTFYVFGREVRYFNDRVRRYLEDNHFTNVSDLQTLDTVITFELLVWRWGIWLSQQRDYLGDPVDEKELAKQLKETSAELRQLKSGLGIDKVTRDKVKGEDSVSKYIENLKLRAREFGINREKQLNVALEMFQELKARVALYDNTTEDEQREMHCTLDELLRWIREEAIPTFDAVDEHFRTHAQRFWIRDQ